MIELFRRIEERSEQSQVEISLSYLEIYNEAIRDLLVEGQLDAISTPSPNPTGAPKPRIVHAAGLQLREDANKRISIPGLTEHKLKTPEDVIALILAGNQRRTMSPTLANATSSRSHAVLQVNIRQSERSSEDVTLATLSIIDLAGSERASSTQNSGARLTEGANINKSLLALGNCINALCEGGKHIPYRNSKLTRLLKFSLGGNCKTVMIVCVSPCSVHYEETQNTLKYANRAKNIKTKITRNTINADHHVREYVRTIAELREHNAQLKAQLDQNKSELNMASAKRKQASENQLVQAIEEIKQKAMASKQALIDVATCQATIEAAEARLQILQNRLDELQKLPKPRPNDLQAEFDLLNALSSADRFVAAPQSGVHTHLSQSQRTANMLDASVKLIASRRYDNIEPYDLRHIEDAVRIDALQTESAQYQARAKTLLDSLTEPQKYLSKLVGVGARCTISMKEAASLLKRKPDSAASIAETLLRLAEQNDMLFRDTLGVSTSSPKEHNAFDPFLSDLSSPPVLRALQRASPMHPSVSRSLPRANMISPQKAQRLKSPRKGSAPLRPSAVKPGVLFERAVSLPTHRSVTDLESLAAPPPSGLKKSLRWRDEASDQSLCDRKSLSFGPSMLGGSSESEWEDEAAAKVLSPLEVQSVPKNETLLFPLKPPVIQRPAVPNPTDRPVSNSRRLSSNGPLPIRRPNARADPVLNLPGISEDEPSSSTQTQNGLMKRPPFTDVANITAQRATPTFAAPTAASSKKVSRMSISGAPMLQSPPASSSARRMSGIGPLRSQRPKPRMSHLSTPALMKPLSPPKEQLHPRPSILGFAQRPMKSPMKSPRKVVRRASLAGAPLIPQSSRRISAAGLRPLRILSSERSFDTSMTLDHGRAAWK